MPQDDKLKMLLRLKRYERPADPQYFEKFLADFQNRQRSELLRTPISALLAEHFANLCKEFLVPRLAYAGALATLLAAATFLVTLPKASTPSTAFPLASAQPNSSAAHADAPSRQLATSARPSGMLLDGVSLPQVHAVYASHQQHTTNPPPRYVMDARPMSYQANFSF